VSVPASPGDERRMTAYLYPRLVVAAGVVLIIVGVAQHAL
jgi:hypothetical protein